MFRIIAWLGKTEKLTQCYVNESFESNTYLGIQLILGWISRLCIPYKTFHHGSFRSLARFWPHAESTCCGFIPKLPAG